MFFLNLLLQTYQEDWLLLDGELEHHFKGNIFYKW